MGSHAERNSFRIPFRFRATSHCRRPELCLSTQHHPEPVIRTQLGESQAGDYFASQFVIRASPERHLNLFFEYSGELHCDSQLADAPSPSKAHVQTARAGVTSGAQDFENVEKFGHRYLNRADSENHPAKDSKTRHSSATQQACQSLRNCWRQVKSWCCDCANAKTGLRAGEVLFRFRFLTVRQVQKIKT